MILIILAIIALGYCMSYGFYLIVRKDLQYWDNDYVRLLKFNEDSFIAYAVTLIAIPHYVIYLVFRKLLRLDIQQEQKDKERSDKEMLKIKNETMREI